MVVFELDSASSDLEELDFTVTYSGGGIFKGETSAVACSEHSDAAAAISASSFSDDDAGKLTVQLDALAGNGGTPLAANTKIVQCVFQAAVAPTTGNFSIVIDKAEDDTNATVADASVIVVSPISENTTSSSSTTTTTAGTSPSTTGSDSTSSTSTSTTSTTQASSLSAGTER